MTRNVIWQDHEPALQPVDETVDHVRGLPAGRLILEYGDYECPYSRQAFRAIERVDFELTGEELSQLDALDRAGLPGTLLNADGGETAGGRPSQSRDPDRSRLGDPLAGLPLGDGRPTGL